MNAALKPLLSSRTEYIGYRHVSEGDFEAWVALNIDALANRFFQQGGMDLDKLAAFSASEWEKQRASREDYRRTAESFDGAI